MTDDKAKPDDPAQSQRFIDMAREVEAREDAAEFERIFTKIAGVPKDLNQQPRSKARKKDHD